MKATKKEELISYEEILSRLGGGYDGFMYYHGSVPKKCKRPWGRDKSPSFGFFQKEGIWYFGDFATEERGTLADFVMKMFNLNWVDAINKIKWDFGLTQVKNLDAVKVTWERPIIENKPSIINFTTQKFKKQHHEYWNCVGVSEDYCKKYECYAIKELSLNRKRIPIPSGEAVFGYYIPETKKVKIYFPQRRESKFLGNVDYYHIWNLNNIEKCDKLVVIKSMKDLITVSQFFPCIVSTQNESVQLFSEEVVNTLNSLAKEIVVFFGSDADGVKKCKEITKKFSWKYLNTPKVSNPDINDAYSYCKEYGIETLEKYLKLKKLI